MKKNIPLKKFAILFLTCLMIVLTACHTSTGPASEENKIQESEDKNPVGEKEQESSQEDSQDGSDGITPTGDLKYKLSSIVQAMSITEKGYYYIANSIMYFYDLTNDISIPMCSRTDCSHRTGGCDAYASRTKNREIEIKQIYERIIM